MKHIIRVVTIAVLCLVASNAMCDDVETSYGGPGGGSELPMDNNGASAAQIMDSADVMIGNGKYLEAAILLDSVSTATITPKMRARRKNGLNVARIQVVIQTRTLIDSGGARRAVRMLQEHPLVDVRAKTRRRMQAMMVNQGWACMTQGRFSAARAILQLPFCSKSYVAKSKMKRVSKRRGMLVDAIRYIDAGEDVVSQDGFRSLQRIMTSLKRRGRFGTTVSLAVRLKIREITVAMALSMPARASRALSDCVTSEDWVNGDRLRAGLYPKIPAACDWYDVWRAWRHGQWAKCIIETKDMVHAGRSPLIDMDGDPVQYDIASLYFEWRCWRNLGDIPEAKRVAKLVRDDASFDGRLTRNRMVSWLDSQ